MVFHVISQFLNLLSQLRLVMTPWGSLSREVFLPILFKFETNGMSTFAILLCTHATGCILNMWCCKIPKSKTWRWLRWYSLFTVTKELPREAKLAWTTSMLTMLMIFFSRGNGNRILDRDDEDPWPRFWLTEASQCHKQLKLLIDSPYLLRDIGRMSPFAKTAGLRWVPLLRLQDLGLSIKSLATLLLKILTSSPMLWKLLLLHLLTTFSLNSHTLRCVSNLTASGHQADTLEAVDADWTAASKHLSCMQDPPCAPLYITNKVVKLGGMELNNFILHVNYHSLLHFKPVELYVFLGLFHLFHCPVEPSQGVLAGGWRICTDLMHGPTAGTITQPTGRDTIHKGAHLRCQLCGTHALSWQVQWSRPGRASWYWICLLPVKRISLSSTTQSK